MIGQAPAFWSRRDALAGRLLAPLGALAGAVALRRMARPGGTVPVPVICVGNPTVGGAGKTPTAIALLRRIAARGGRPFALLRGHGGSAGTPLLVDPARHDAGAVGDEALLLAAHAPTVIAGGDRLAGARLAVSLGATHLVMDDGFQNPSLHKDAALLVVDGAAGVGNGRILPAGPLRAPLAAQLARADALLVVGDGTAGDDLARTAGAAGCKVLRAVLRPDPAAVARLKDTAVLAFAGIGRPEKVFDTLRTAGIQVAATRSFPDHHAYLPAEIAALIAEAEAAGLALVTTEKDMARLDAARFAAARARLSTLPVTLETDGAELDSLVAKAEERAAARG